MNYLLWLITGGVIGWITGLLTGNHARGELLPDVLIGSVGAFLARLCFAPLLSVSFIAQTHLNVLAMFVSFLGAIIVLVVFNRLQHVLM